MRRKEEFRKCLLGGRELEGGRGGLGNGKKGRGKGRERGRGPKHRLLRVVAQRGESGTCTSVTGGDCERLYLFGGVWRAPTSPLRPATHFPFLQPHPLFPLAGAPLYRTESTRRNKSKRKCRFDPIVPTWSQITPIPSVLGLEDWIRRYSDNDR